MIHPETPIPPAQPFRAGEPSVHPPKPKRRIGLIVGAIAVVIILILGIVLADYFVFKTLIFKEEAKEYTLSMQELVNDLTISPTTYGLGFKTYKPGTIINLHDTVANVSTLTTSYGTYTMVNFTVSYMGYPTNISVAFEGDKRSEYPKGSAVTIQSRIVEYTICGKSGDPPTPTETKFEWLDDDLPFPLWYWMVGFYGPADIALNERFTTEGNVKLVVRISDWYTPADLSDYSVVLEDYKSQIVASIPALSQGATSSDEEITFTDANANGLLDEDDYFIISLGTTGSKYVIKSYTLTLKCGDINETSKGLGLWHKGFFYTESYYEPTGGYYPSYLSASWASEDSAGTDANVNRAMLSIYTGNARWNATTWQLVKDVNVTVLSKSKGTTYAAAGTGGSIVFRDINANEIIDGGDYLYVNATSDYNGYSQIKCIVGGSVIFQIGGFI